MEEGDGGGGGGRSGKDGFSVDCRRERDEPENKQTVECLFVVRVQSDAGSSTCFDCSPVAQRPVVLGLRVLEVHAVDGAAVHGGGALPGGLGPEGVVGDVRADGHGWGRLCTLSLRGQWGGLARGGGACQTGDKVAC